MELNAWLVTTHCKHGSESQSYEPDLKKYTSMLISIK